MRIDERAPPDVHCERRVTFKTILTTGPSRCGAGFKALLIIDVDECSPLDSVANRYEIVLPKWGDEFQLAWPWCQLMRAPTMHPLPVERGAGSLFMAYKGL